MIATCPACGHAQSVYAVFIRVGGDLVCQPCRQRMTAERHRDGGGSPRAPASQLPPPPRRHLNGRIG